MELVLRSRLMVARIHSHRRGYLFLREWMEHRRLGDERLAGRLGVARETVTRWRNQQHRLNPEKIARLASALDCDPADLWRSPDAPPSIDALVREAPEDVRGMALDIVRRLINR
jgi:transcriptional regulator with XRE-family HTH domain